MRKKAMLKVALSLLVLGLSASPCLADWPRMDAGNWPRVSDEPLEGQRERDNQWRDNLDGMEAASDFTEHFLALCQGEFPYDYRSADCYGTAHGYWDRILNQNYKLAMKLCGLDSNPQKCRETLRNEERAWLRKLQNAIDSVEEKGVMGRHARAAISYEEVRKRAEELGRRILK